MNFLINIVGTTAIGKTALAIALAQHFDTEILSCDSRQFYKEMCIGTAVPSPEELAAAPHHFIQHKSIFDSYSVGDFEREATAFLSDFFLRKPIIIMVGGSGLYNDAILKGLDDFPPVKEGVREQLNQLHKENGITALQQQLKALDPAYYDKVDLQNPQRIIRALEVCLSGGQPYSYYSAGFYPYYHRPKCRARSDLRAYQPAYGGNAPLWATPRDRATATLS